MKRFQLGMVLETTGQAVRAALASAARLGAYGLRGLQIDAVQELNPDQLSQTGRRELKTLLKSYNLELAAINCPLRRGLDSQDQLQLRLEHLQKVMDLAADLGPRLVTMPLPKLATDPLAPSALTLRESLNTLGKYGDKIGVRIALEGGADPGDKVRDYLKSYDLGSLSVGFDPANFYLNNFDPLTSLAALAGHVSYVQARDVRQAMRNRTSQEVALGHGNIDWMLFIATLESIDYHGYIVVDREQGETRLADVSNGVRFLARFVPVSES